MVYVSAQWSDATQTLLVVTQSDGNVVYVPADVGNRDYNLIINGGDDQEVLIITPHDAVRK